MYVGRPSFGVGGHEEKDPCWWWARSRFGRVGFEVEG